MSIVLVSKSGLARRISPPYCCRVTNSIPNFLMSPHNLKHEVLGNTVELRGTQSQLGYNCYKRLALCLWIFFSTLRPRFPFNVASLCF